MMIFYFSPHQDDELLNLGAAMCRDIDAGHQVFCVLCTDGGASGARRMLGDGGVCHWHGGRHDFPMDVPAFSAARDLEFTESCRRMGLPDDHILLPDDRAGDGQLTEDHALRLMRQAVSRFPVEQVAVKTLSEVTWRHQNPDHTAVARAALRLYREGGCASLTEYLETILYPAPEELPVMETVLPTPAQRKRLLNAAEIYCRWQPEEERFAVGFHSVADEFIAFREEQISRVLTVR